MTLVLRTLRGLLLGLMLAWAALPSGPARAAALQMLCCDQHAMPHGHQDLGVRVDASDGEQHHGHAQLCEGHCLQVEGLRLGPVEVPPTRGLRLLRAAPLRESFASLDRQPAAPPPKA